MVSTKVFLYCSFCGKNQHEVRKLIAGPNSYICNECVERCNDIMEEEIKTPNGQRFMVPGDLGLPDVIDALLLEARGWYLDYRLERDRSKTEAKRIDLENLINAGRFDKGLLIKAYMAGRQRQIESE